MEPELSLDAIPAQKAGWLETGTCLETAQRIVSMLSFWLCMLSLNKAVEDRSSAAASRIFFCKLQGSKRDGSYSFSILSQISQVRPPWGLCSVLVFIFTCANRLKCMFTNGHIVIAFMRQRWLKTEIQKHAAATGGRSHAWLLLFRFNYHRYLLQTTELRINASVQQFCNPAIKVSSSLTILVLFCSFKLHNRHNRRSRSLDTIQ